MNISIARFVLVSVVVFFAGANSAFAADAYGTPGTYTYTVGNYTQLYVQIAGGGGGGGGWGGSYNYFCAITPECYPGVNGGAGASGGYTEATISVTPGQSFTFYVGGGGTGGAFSYYGSAGGGGGSSSFGGYIAGGGGGGGGAASKYLWDYGGGGGGGGGGTGSGANGYVVGGGSGGSGYGSGGQGGYWSGLGQPGAAGSSYGGNGGQSAYNTGVSYCSVTDGDGNCQTTSYIFAPGSPGSVGSANGGSVVPGGGGGGGAGSSGIYGNGSAGTNGYVIITQQNPATCTNGALNYPTCTIPVPTGLTASCTGGNQVTFSWTAPAGYSHFYTRASTGGVNIMTDPPWSDDFIGTSKTFTGTAGQSYLMWVHTRTSTGAYSDAAQTTANCAVPVNGSCSATHYNCSSPAASTNNAVQTTSWTWSCPGSNGGTTASCSEVVPPPTNLTASCNAAGNSISVSWTAPSGYTHFYTRAHTPASDGLVGPSGPGWQEDFIGTSYSFAATLGTWNVWVHAKTSAATPYSDVVATTVTCAPPTATTITVNKSPRTLYQGQIMTKSYSTANATALSFSCTGNGTPSASGIPLQEAPNDITWDTIYNTYGFKGAYSCIWKASGPGGDSYFTDDFNIVAPSATTATLSASPNPVASGGRSTLTWSSTNATSCTAGGPWSNQGTLSGSGLTDPLTSAATFTFQCTGPGGTSPLQSVTVTVAPPASCANGANNPTACNQCPNGLAWVGGSCVACDNGGCSGGGGSANNPLGSLVCVNGASNPQNCNSFPPGTPTATLSPSQVTIVKGQSTTLTWTTNHTSGCYPIVGDQAGGGFSTGGASNGNDSVSPTETSYYQISCTSPTVSSNISTVTVLQPQASISANKMRVKSGDTSTISWSASQVTSCAVTKNGAAWRTGLAPVPSTGILETITGQTVYTITCQTVGDPITDSITVNIIPLFQEF